LNHGMYRFLRKQLKQMMQYFYCLCLLLGCTEFSLQAKMTSPAVTAPTAGSKKLNAGASLAANSPVAPPAKAQSPAKSETTVTQDVFRGAVVAKRQTAPPPAPVVAMVSKKAHTAKASPSSVATTRTTKTYASELSSIRSDLESNGIAAGERLARVTAYWAGEGDYYTRRLISATGVHLHDGHCAVDPSIIPYGSVVVIAGIGKYLAVDTGSAVIHRTAARESGHTSQERNALVIDLFFEDRSEGEKFAAAATRYATISWWTPTASNTLAKVARSLFAEEDWLKIQSKQL
jgi:3D (Asp-Asp-Asp) domain-containing protein